VEFNERAHTRRNNYKLLKSSHYFVRKYSFTARVVNIWNSLPDYIVDADSVHTFKSRVNFGLINQSCLIGKQTLPEPATDHSSVIL